MTQTNDATETGHVLTTEEVKHLTEAGGKPADTLMNLKTAVGNIGERQEVDSMEFCAAPHPTKMVKSSMFATLFGLKQLAVPAVCQLPFLGSSARTLQ